ncbi:MAG: NAD-dependent epimerase [Betaproteobacteria bacterium]|nr:NAD-dependent epimerase [Betaproteobacteria bacterium]
MKILVTGVAGFIGMFTARALLERGDEVIGIDNLNDYYDVNLKMARLAQLAGYPKFRFIKLDIADNAALSAFFAQERFERVVHLAAQAGVRYSLENPQAYVESNLAGFVNVLEGCRNAHVEHLVYASSSSVYGGNTKLPYSEQDMVDTPVSLYAATKKANELMAHTYSHLFGLPTTGLRFFTVYGPWGRPDMAYFKFTKAISEGKPIDVYNHGDMRRDFTYIDDIVEGVVRVLDLAKTEKSTPYRVFNIGNHASVNLLDFIKVIEDALSRLAEKRLLPMQDGDVVATYADIEALQASVGFSPSTSVEVGIKRFVDWYQEYYKN